MPDTAHKHWKALTDPDLLGAWALPDGKEAILTIDYISKEDVVGPNGNKDKCIVAHFKEDKVKPMVLNATNCKTLTKLYKTPYIDQWCGRKVQIYVEHGIRMGGEVKDGLRIRPFMPKQKVAERSEYKCSDCGAVIADEPNMKCAEIAQRTQDKYGKVLCLTCAKKAAVDKTKTSESALNLAEELNEGGEQ